jgi:hypothetical protein
VPRIRCTPRGAEGGGEAAEAGPQGQEQGEGQGVSAQDRTDQGRDGHAERRQDHRQGAQGRQLLEGPEPHRQGPARRHHPGRRLARDDAAHQA